MKVIHIRMVLRIIEEVVLNIKHKLDILVMRKLEDLLKVDLGQVGQWIFKRMIEISRRESIPYKAERIF